MEKEFVPYIEALELKQLGFDIPSVSGYSYSDSDNLLTQAILYQQAFRWFREKHTLDNATMKDKFVIETDEDLPKWYYGFNTYEEAELACLQKLIEIVKTK